MNFLRNLIVYISATVIGWYFSYQIGEMHAYFFPGSGGSFIDGTALVGLPLGYIFFNILFLKAFGVGKKNIWIIFCLMPVVLLELYLDLEHIYFPILIGIAGWGLGLGVDKGLKLIKKY